MDPAGLGVLKLAAAHQAPCKPSVQVKTWTSRREKEAPSFFSSFSFLTDSRGMQLKSRFYSSVSGFIKRHQSCATLSPLPFILWKCDSCTACFFLTFFPTLVLLHLPLSRALSLSRSRYPCSPSVLLCEVTCESDQLNPDHQLCLTYFRFGTLGFSLFHFCLCGISMNAQHTHAVWPAAFGS